MLATPGGMLGGGLHIATHAFGKITLFFCAGAIMVAAHKTEISQLRGIGRTMPWTMGAFLIGSLSVIGLPPFGGLWSKWYLALGALEAEQIVLVGVLMVSTLLNIAYLLPIPFRAFFSPASETPGTVHIHEAPLPCLIAIGVAATGCVAMFFAAGPILSLLAPLVAR